MTSPRSRARRSGWLEDMEGAFDEEVAARELAWALVEMMAGAMKEVLREKD